MIMAAKPLTLSPNYLSMVRGTRELHQLIAAGKGDSPEADAIRDATDGPWAALSEVERDRAGNLSEDLFSLTEPAPIVQPMNPEVRDKLDEALEARQLGEWDKALDLLRCWRAFIDPASLSYLRGSIWLKAGDMETAALFFKHAVKLNPDNEIYRESLFDALDSL
jgi:tetratricopeptide (TPR) repeat protein